MSCRSAAETGGGAVGCRSSRGASSDGLAPWEGHGGVAAQGEDHVTRKEKPGIRPAADDIDGLRRRVEGPGLANVLMGGGGRGRKRPRRRPGAPFEPGEDHAGGPASPDVVTGPSGPRADDPLEWPPLSSRPCRV